MVLEANLIALAQYNVTLSQKLRGLPLGENVQLFTTDNQTFNLAYRNTALHRLESPDAEAQDVIAAQNLDPDKAHQTVSILFGLGLGYFLHHAVAQTHGIVIVYEPNCDVLRLTLEAVDFTHQWQTDRVRIAHTLDDLYALVHNHYQTGDQINLMVLPAYSQLEQAQYDLFLEKVRDAVHSVEMIANTFSEQAQINFAQSLNNMWACLRYQDVKLTHGLAKGHTGIVVSAGPSLDQPGVLASLKALQGKVVISCVLQALRALVAAGIRPDFVLCLESREQQAMANEVDPQWLDTLIVTPAVAKTMFGLPFQRKMIAYSEGDPITQWLAKAHNTPYSQYRHQGTVSLLALHHLIQMGCDKVILLGQDLAFQDGKMYAAQSAYKNRRIEVDASGQTQMLWDNRHEFEGTLLHDNRETDKPKAHQNWMDSLTEIPGWEGQPLTTYRNYKLYRDYFSQAQLENPSVTMVNCSQGGALIPHLLHLPFQAAIEQFELDKTDGMQTLQTALETGYTDRPFSAPVYQQAYALAIKDKETMIRIAGLLAEALPLIGRIEQELKRAASISGSLASRLEKARKLSDQVSTLCTGLMINDLIAPELMLYEQQHARKLNHIQQQPSANGLLRYDDVVETVTVMQFLLTTVHRGIETLRPMWDTMVAENLFDIIDFI